MKNILITLILLFGASHSNAQYAPLKIGEAVPDFEFAIQNYPTPTAKLSDFKGKLIILDFWSTSCSSCIAGFPKMEQVQKEYGDKIQIILVNIRETKEEIKTRLKSRTTDIPTLKQIPSVINNKNFAQLFPHRFAGNYIWIDLDGNFILSSAYDYNIYKAKIDDVLAGKENTFLRDGKAYNQDEPSLSELINKDEIKRPEFGSMFTAINLEYLPVGGLALAKTDSISQTIRNTYMNRAVLTLYYITLKETLEKEWKSKIYGPNLGSRSYLDMFHVIVKDSSLYDNRFLSPKEEIDVNIIKSYYCYEQILPQHTSSQEAHRYMREDLDRYFGLKYGTTVKVEEVAIPCYIIRKTNTPSFSEKEIKSKMKHLGKREYSTIRSLDFVIESYFRKLELDIPYIFNEDEVNKYIPIILPVWKNGDKVDDFQEVLRLNGLEFSKEERKMKMVVVRDHQQFAKNY